jgi:hypothetical protein
MLMLTRADPSATNWNSIDTYCSLCRTVHPLLDDRPILQAESLFTVCWNIILNGNDVKLCT